MNINKNISESDIKKPKHKYKGYTIKEKWLVSLLLSLFAPISLCLFAPFEIYANNMNEFKFVLWDFWSLCALIAVGCAAVIFGLLMLVRGRAFDICFGLIFGLSLMLFVQGNYLSLGVGSLAGDGIGDTISTTKTVINLIIWVAVVIGCVLAMLLLNRFKETLRLVSTVAVIALVGMTAISFAVISMTTDVYAKEKTGDPKDETVDTEVLTIKNLDTLATDNNIVVFIVDRFDHTYYDTASKDCPEIFDDLEGFTHFDDYVTLYPRTYPGVAHILTGVEADFASNGYTRYEYMKNAFGTSPYMTALKEKNFDINVYTDSFYGYENATHMRNFVSNTSGNVSYKIVDTEYLSLDMLRVSLYRYLPFIVRDAVGNVSTTMYDRYVEYETPQPVFRSDMKDVYQELTDNEFTFREAKDGVAYIHISGCHLPNDYNADFGKVTDEEMYDSNVAMKLSFKIISAYINEMKRMGVYEKSTIIILGDHCNIESDTEFPYKPHVTTLLAKPSGVATGKITESSAQISPENVFATVLSAAGSDKASNYGETVFDVPEGQNRVRRYHFQAVDGNLYEGNYQNVIYEIVGSGNDMKNWRVVDIEDLKKNIYD